MLFYNYFTIFIKINRKINDFITNLLIFKNLLLFYYLLKICHPNNINYKKIPPYRCKMIKKK